MLSTVISGIVLAIVSWMAKKFAVELKDLIAQCAALTSSQRNQLKASIVRSYEEAERQGYITAMELDTLNRRADSYAALHGNTYIETIRNHANNMTIKGSLPPYNHEGEHDEQ